MLFSKSEMPGSGFSQSRDFGYKKGPGYRDCNPYIQEAELYMNKLLLRCKLDSHKCKFHDKIVHGDNSTFSAHVYVCTLCSVKTITIMCKPALNNHWSLMIR